MSLGGWADPRGTAAPWRDSVVIGGAALFLYLALAQEALHGLDVHVHVYFLTQGHLELPTHLLYMKLVGSVWPALRELGMTPHHALRLLSAVGTALGVVFCHRAASRLGRSRGHAGVVAGLCAVPAAVLFFATVPEIHGVFAAFAGLAWWAWAAVLAVPGPWRAVCLGASLGVASSVHATGHLQLGLAVLLGWALWGTRGWRVAWQTVAVTVIAHSALAVGLALLLQPAGLAMPFQGQVAFLRDVAGQANYSIATLGRTVRDEWLLAFLPLSVTSLLALGRAGTRRLAVATAIGLLVYLAFAFVLLDYLNERGAYLLPLAFPFALLTAALLGKRAALFAGLLALVWAVAQVRAHDHVDHAAWVEGFVALAREVPTAVICRDVAEQEQITRAVPDVPFVRVDSLVPTAEQGDAAFATFCQGFDAIVAQLRGAGRSVLITRAAYETMAASGQPFFARFLTEHLAQHYLLEEVARGGFAAYRVRAR